MEDIQFDAAGQLVTGSFMDYAMPRAHHFSAMEVESNPVPTKTNPLGVKGAGEAGCVGALPAVANALVDALSEFGVQAHRDAGDARAHLARDAGVAAASRAPSLEAVIRSLCHAPRKRGIQYAVPPRSIAGASDYWIVRFRGR